ncbi:MULTISPECIES: hypothetical protein [Bradyrhizobium]|uniref:hypothetical protein n=1 Tax=Bradyrhizobium TaxID=374 RepID=UPI000488017B|nr:MULTISPECIES: hypothetical protein [Bradyrhizobium]UFW46387.1 hypothetical protein BaraCB756_29290 [Bradyrhizobium arachidis]
MVQLKLPSRERSIRDAAAPPPAVVLRWTVSSGHGVILAAPTACQRRNLSRVLTAPDFANDQSAVGPLAALDYYPAVVPGVATPRRLAHDHVAFDHARWRTNDFFFPDLS